MTDDALVKSRARALTAQEATIDPSAAKIQADLVEMKADLNRYSRHGVSPPPTIDATDEELVDNPVEQIPKEEYGKYITADVEEGIATAAVTTVNKGGGDDDMPAQPIQNELNDNMPTYYPSNDNFQEESYYPAIDYPAMDIPSEEIPFDGTTGGIQAFVVPTVYDATNVIPIQDDEELEKEAKKRYTRKIMLRASILAVIAIAIVVPTVILTGGGETVTEEPSASPTNVPSLMPSFAPSSNAFQQTISLLTDESFSAENSDVVSLFRELGVSTMEQLLDDSTPQGKAANWVANEDPISPPLEIGSQKYIQRYIMAVFYYAMDGPNWITCSEGGSVCNNGSPWLSEDDECDWFGSGCVNGELSQIFQGGFQGNNIFGTFPEEICYFTEMSTIVLNNNKVQGTIPPCFGRFSKLGILGLTSNSIDLPFPDEAIEGWTNLKLLLLAGNLLEGPFPQSLTKLPALEELQIDSNSLTGTLPAFNRDDTPKLKVLFLELNGLTGSIPSDIFDIETLEHLNITGNSFNGSLPANIGQDFGNSNPLEVLDVGRNDLTGEIPENVYNASNMVNLVLSSNNFTGQIRSDIFTNLFQLRILALDNNGFSGPVPETLSPLSQLTTLALQKNDFDGVISDSICNATVKGNARIQLRSLTIDCEEVTCECCTNCGTTTRPRPRGT
uniref:L domain-like protein n=1 Tax=Ditylum brightwellii TaxID=49249 RepID=A0A7S4SIU6_9STRA